MSRPISTYFSKSSTLDISGGSSAVEGSAEDANAQDTAIKRTLMKVFGLTEFRGAQEAIVKAALAGNDCFVLMPTGGGKSLTYQLPAVRNEGVTLVVSPLLALIQNQVEALKKINIKAATINSTLKAKERKEILADLSSNKPTIKLLYVTPELMATESFRAILLKLNKRDLLSRLVIDEAHCISEWGHDFRSDYRKLKWFKETFNKLPIMALTATATDDVRSDIIKQLKLPPTLKIFVASFNRPNLYYEVRFKPPSNNPYPDLLQFLESVYENRRKRLSADSTSAERIEGVCGIVYCATRACCDEVAQKLREDGIRSRSYHAGLKDAERRRILKAWSGTDAFTAVSHEDKKGCGESRQEVVDVVVATISFGMGIDKKDVRFVVHWDMSKSLEGYYQESGRAGRDGKVARCILYYSHQDRDRQTYLLQQESESRSASRTKAMESFSKMVEYCEDVQTCRHVFFDRYFGATDTKAADLCPSKRCDVCKDPGRLKKEKAAAMQLGGFLSGRQFEAGGNFRLKDGTWVAPLPPKRGYDEVSSLDYGIGGDDANFVRSRKRQRRQALDDIEEDSEEEGFFRRASSLKQSEPVGIRQMLGMAKRDASFISAKDMSKTTYPLIITPSHAVADLTLKDREKGYDQFLKALKGVPVEDDQCWAWNIDGEMAVDADRRCPLLEATAASLESKCFLSSKIGMVYKNALMQRMREIKRLGAPGGAETVTLKTFLEERKKFIS